MIKHISFFIASAALCFSLLLLGSCEDTNDGHTITDSGSPDLDTDTDVDIDAGSDAGKVEWVWNWIPLPPGTYAMGGTHSVSIPAFELSQTEVTATQYAQCVNGGICTPPNLSAVSSSRDCTWNQAGKEHHPMNCVEWQQAVDFCAWEEVGGRLPSESEWEYAARSGGEQIIVATYPWGNEEATCAYAVMNDKVVGSGSGCNAEAVPWVVCNKLNGNTSQGVCDMAGNVWEWVQDKYDPDLTKVPDDGSALEIGTDRNIRGGWFGGDADYLKNVLRQHAPPLVPTITTGFRCARDI